MFIDDDDVTKQEILMAQCTREKMQELLEQGTTGKELVNMFDTDMNTLSRVKAMYGVVGKYAKSGRPTNVTNTITCEALRDRLEKGMSLQQIASEFYCV